MHWSQTRQDAAPAGIEQHLAGRPQDRSTACGFRFLAGGKLPVPKSNGEKGPFDKEKAEGEGGLA
jgi:hypothetical protein